METILTNHEAVIESKVSDGDCQPTNRVLPTHVNVNGKQVSEWCETATLEGVPICVYYIIENDLDEWYFDEVPIDRIEIDLCQCDKENIDNLWIDEVVRKYSL